MAIKKQKHPQRRADHGPVDLLSTGTRRSAVKKCARPGCDNPRHVTKTNNRVRTYCGACESAFTKRSRLKVKKEAP